MRTTALAFATLLTIAAPAHAQKPTSGYAPVNGLKMYYEIHGSGSGEPLVLLHGSFMTLTNNWTPWIAELAKRRKVIAVEMQGHGRTADIKRDFSYENLADDIAALLDFLKIGQADVLGYSMGGGVEVIRPQKHTKGTTPPTHEGQVDHMTARSKGGSGTPDNGQLLCRDCNLEKSDR